MDKALLLPGAQMIDMHTYGVRLLRRSRNHRALKVFLLNQKQHPEEKFWTYYDLARAYTALGRKDQAIANWETAIANVPQGRRSMLPKFQSTVAKLRTGS